MHWESQCLEALAFLTKIFIALKLKVKEHYPAGHFLMVILPRSV